jgi:hypothetical protein
MTYTSVAFSALIQAFFVNSRGCLSVNPAAILPELRTLRCSASRTVRIYSSLDTTSFPLQASINWSCRSQRTAAVCYTVNRRSFPTVWLFSHLTIWCFLFVLLPVLQMIFKCASWAIFLGASLAASQWTNCCVHSWCVPISDILDEAPAN